MSSSAPSVSGYGESATTGWFALGPDGLDLATGRPPRGRGAGSPLAALGAAPVASWPLVMRSGVHQLGLGEVLGPGGATVERLLAALVGRFRLPLAADPADLAVQTPAGELTLPLALVDARVGAQAAAHLDTPWVEAVTARRAEARSLVVASGRQLELEAALHVALLLGAGLSSPGDDVLGRMAAGHRFWVLTGALAWALTGRSEHPFAAWSLLVLAGLWPVGPSQGRLVVSRS